MDAASEKPESGAVHTLTLAPYAPPRGLGRILALNVQKSRHFGPRNDLRVGPPADSPGQLGQKRFKSIET